MQSHVVAPAMRDNVGADTQVCPYAQSG